jgi:hypothetical protein
MRDQTYFKLRLDGDTATLCVRGMLDEVADATMIDVCAALPLHVRTLRVDLRPPAP